MSARLVLAFALSTAGCTQIFGLDPPVAPLSDGSIADSRPDVVDGPDIDATYCYGTGLYSICFDAQPSGALALAGTLDTDNDPRCASQATDACVIAAGSISLGNLKANGALPLVLVAVTDLDIADTLDVGSRFLYNGTTPIGMEKGAGTGSTPACPTAGTGADKSGTDGAGGGAGGSFHTRGGNGGRGGGSALQASAALEVSLPATLQGGCSGGGGGTSTALSAGVGGLGGGAVYLSASSVKIEGTINAGGSGGTGGLASQAGGGGGGTGGMIAINAPAIACSGGRVLANGGGGGEGGGVSTSAGNPGESASNVLTTAQGGTGANQYGGDGGNGSFNSASGNAGQTGNLLGGDGGGGGGAGGGAGFIKVYGGGSLSGCTVSPPAL